MTTTFWAWASPHINIILWQPHQHFPYHFANKKNFNNLHTLSTPIWLEVITEATIYEGPLFYARGHARCFIVTFKSHKKAGRGSIHM